MSAITAEEIVLHGHRVRFHKSGEGPLLVLLHGIASTADTWEPVIAGLAAEHTVIAPDLLGHGESAKPRGDYSLGAYASGVRDLLAALGHDRAHGRRPLARRRDRDAVRLPVPRARRAARAVGSGGLGREVSLALRAATLPGSELVLPLLGSRRAASAPAARSPATLGAARLQAGAGPRGDRRGFASLADASARSAFVHTVRAVIDPGGQRVSARDRLYLAAGCRR